MNLFAQTLRKESAELHEAATTLLESSDLNVNPKKQIQAIVGFVASKQLAALADLATYLKEGDKLDARTERLDAIMKRMDAIRLAAAKGSASGDWDDFDKLATGIAGNGDSS
jgi:hypothetical protein